MSSSQSTLSCANCSTPQSSLPSALLRCARCHTARYCSRPCQRSNWSAHKPNCSPTSNGGSTSTSSQALPRTRTPTRMSYESFLELNNDGSDPAVSATPTTASSNSTSSTNLDPPDDDNIYYLKTSTPHAHDISISGPYHPLSSIVEQVRYTFHTAGCPAGVQQISTLAAAGHASLRTLTLTPITAPVASDPAHTITISLITEHNPHMARRLPGPAYSVIVSEPDFELYSRMSREGSAAGRPPPVKGMQVRGTFQGLEEANGRAMEVGEGLAAGLVGGRFDPGVAGDGKGGGSDAVKGLVVGRDEAGARKGFAVEVRLDEGVTRSARA